MLVPRIRLGKRAERQLLDGIDWYEGRGSAGVHHVCITVEAQHRSNTNTTSRSSKPIPSSEAYYSLLIPNATVCLPY